MREELPRFRSFEGDRVRKKKGSLRFKRLGARIVRLHDRIANLRRDFMHQETTRLVRQCAVLATEDLAPRNMSRRARGSVGAPGRYAPDQTAAAVLSVPGTGAQDAG